MARVHFLTVGDGDCTIIQHNSGHVTMIDICGGNKYISESRDLLLEALEKPRGNFAMCKKPTNPITYLKGIGVTRIFRFILTHPDMDHLDGFDALLSTFPVDNFWDSGARKQKPDFGNGSPYREEDWDRYTNVLNGREEGLTVVHPLAGSRFKYANRADDGTGGGDGLYVAAPSKALVDDANKKQDFNDASYIISYRSVGGKIIFPGDAHDGAWGYAMGNHKDDIDSCSFLLAPHHGRDSGMSFDFLRVARPTLSLLGCAPSEDLAYSAWNNKELVFITQNQAGNVVLEISDGRIDVYIQNEVYADKAGGDSTITNNLGYAYIYTITQ